MGIELVADGAVAVASRLDNRHLLKALDVWLIETRNPVAVMAPRPGYEPCVRLRSQFVLSLARLDDLPSGGYPREESATHVLALGVLAQDFKREWLIAGVRPAVSTGFLLRAEFEAMGDHTARAVSRAVASGLAAGEMPLQGRHVGSSFMRGVRMVALALGQVTFAPSVQAVPD